MNTKSEDVVKNVESNNVESTSNKQRQTVKPIVISRRRLLRAGVAGVPVVLTMAGIAPGQSIQTQASAASGLVYGGNKVYNRFAGENDIEKDGLVWTDHNGFVLLNTGGVKTHSLTISTESPSTAQTTLSITGYDTNDQPSASAKEFTVSINPPTDLTVNAYLHKTGAWYTDRIETGTSKDLLKYIEDLGVTVKDGSNTVTATKTSEASTFTNTVESWCKTEIQGWNLDNTNQEQNYYLLPSDSSSEIDSVCFNAKVSFEYTVDGYTYKCNNQTVQIPLKLLVSGIPGQVNPGDI